VLWLAKKTCVASDVLKKDLRGRGGLRIVCGGGIGLGNTEEGMQDGATGDRFSQWGGGEKNLLQKRLGKKKIGKKEEQSSFKKRGKKGEPGGASK